MSVKEIDMLNKKFGKLLVISQSVKGKTYYNCLCDCGNETIVYGCRLRRKNGGTKSCGCLMPKNEKSITSSAKVIWQKAYKNGCSFEKFLELSQENCFHCNRPPSNSYNKFISKKGIRNVKKASLEWANKATFVYNGLDRIDSSLNHSEENIVPCCWTCNRAKSARILVEFEKWIIDVAKHILWKREMEEKKKAGLPQLSFNYLEKD